MHLLSSLNHMTCSAGSVSLDVWLKLHSSPCLSGVKFTGVPDAVKLFLQSDWSLLSHALKPLFGSKRASAFANEIKKLQSSASPSVAHFHASPSLSHCLKKAVNCRTEHYSQLRYLRAPSRPACQICRSAPPPFD
jgi:hypothetical protein